MGGDTYRDGLIYLYCYRTEIFASDLMHGLARDTEA